jgi:deoxycytidylate deaminase
VGAVVRSKRVILSAGFNQREKTHPLLRKYSYWPEAGLHAEMHACIGLSDEELRDSTIYVIRLFRNGRVAPSKPCDACIEYLTARGVKSIIYAVDESHSEKLHLANGVYENVCA